MVNRLSHAHLKPGMYSVDYGKILKGDELHYAFFADWGSLYLRWSYKDDNLYWFPVTNTRPDWISLEEWVDVTLKCLDYDHDFDVLHLGPRIIRATREAWTEKKKRLSDQEHPQ